MRIWLSTTAVVILVCLLVLIWLTNRCGPDDVAAAECRAAYARAATARDSAMVDRMRPVTSRPQATVAVNCQTLRASGALGGY